MNNEKTRTTSYHPQSDGLIERFNQTLVQMLATCIEQQPFEWEDHIHLQGGRKVILGRGAAITVGGGQLFKAIIIIKRPTKILIL